MPGVLLPETPAPAAATTTPAVEEPKMTVLSKLVGPPIANIPTTNGLELIRASFDKHADKLAVASLYQKRDFLAGIFESRPLHNDSAPDYLRWTFKQLRTAGELLAAGLASRGVKDGMTIAVFAKGSIEFYMILYAALILRCRFSPMNPQAVANANEVESMLQTVAADVVVAWDKETLEKLHTKLPELSGKLVLRMAVEKPAEPESPAAIEYIEDIVTKAQPLSEALKVLEPFEQIKTNADDNAVILFTSGTSSFPKACPVTHRGLCAIATNFSNGPTGGPTAVVCNHLPIYHIAGGISAGWNPLASGAAVVHPAAQFSAKTTLEAMKLEGVTFMILVPSMIGLLTNDPDLPPPGELSIKSISLGASTILYTDVEKCYEFLGANKVITSYGMTEGLMMTRGHLPREATKAAQDGIQQICPGARIKICHPNSRTVVPRGEAGEVHQGGATTINGYYGKKSDAFYEDEDGIWCMTGDQAIMHPDGGVQITGRYKDLIIRGGVNISPQSIEGVIAKILKLEAHVVGMPDSIAGEVPVAIVRKADVGKASISRLREPIIKELGPRFALEKFISLEELGLNDFPRTSTGKIRKVDLQVLVKKYAQGQAQASQPTEGGSDKPALERVVDIWSEIAGVSPEECTPETNVHDLADSLMLARYASTIRQVFGIPVSLQDLNKARTLGEQAALLEERAETDSSNADLLNDREGPPPAADMVHTEEVEDVATKTRKQCETVLEPLGFAWEDVQDVMTPSQWLQSWVKSRPTSDRFRAAYHSTEADVSTMASAVTEMLRRNDALRAISIPYGDGTDVQAILRHTEKWVSKVIHIREQPVAKAADLEYLIPGNYDLKGGLAQVIVAHVEETNSAGVCLMTIHTTFDAFSLDIMRKDLNTILNKKKPKQHVPYKLWADHLYNQRESAMAKASVKYHVRRLKGLSAMRGALWPPQRTPVWQRGCDRGLDVTYDGSVTTPEDPARRPLLDGAAADCIGSEGIRRANIPRDLNALTKKHGIPAPVLIKAALCLMETRQTGHQNALFTQTFSMRDNWPFMDSWMSRRLPSPLEVTGPTLARIAEIIPVQHEQTVMDWLQKMKVEQDELIGHAHAPYRFVFDALNKASDEASSNGHSNGHTNGESNGHINGETNGHSNGHVNGVNGHANGETNGTSVELQGKPATSETPDIVLNNGELTNGATTQGEPTGILNGQDSDSELLPIPSKLSNLDRSETASMVSEDEVHADFLPRARDGEVMESVRQRINFQWLPIFGANDKKQKPMVKFVSNSHFNEVGLAVKSGMLADHKTVWIKMEWDDGNIRKSEATAWIDEMIKYVEALGKQESWSMSIGDLLKSVNTN